MPLLGVFAQGYYGYPGYNLFDDMMSRKFSWNGMIGARISWNIGALYTRKNDKAKIQMQRENAEVSRERFVFDNRLEQIQQSENISRYRKLMEEDDEIIALRSSVRKAAESKLLQTDLHKRTKDARLLPSPPYGRKTKKGARIAPTKNV